MMPRDTMRHRWYARRGWAVVVSSTVAGLHRRSATALLRGQTCGCVHAATVACSLGDPPPTSARLWYSATREPRNRCAGTAGPAGPAAAPAHAHLGVPVGKVGPRAPHGSLAANHQLRLRGRYRDVGEDLVVVHLLPRDVRTSRVEPWVKDGTHARSVTTTGPSEHAGCRDATTYRSSDTKHCCC